MALYSCRHDGDQYRISKFDDDMNVVSSYLCTEGECDCPAGVRPMCRHREMLPRFLDRKTVGTDWWFDYDRGGWVQVADNSLPVLEAEPEVLPLPMGRTVGSIPATGANGDGLEQVREYVLGVNPSPSPSIESATLPPRPLPAQHYPNWRRV